MPGYRDARKLGLISDTHGLLRPEAVRELAGSDLIIHAGDVGKPDVLPQLEEIAPVLAVRGNVDRGAWAEALPETLVAETAMARIYVLHDVKQLHLEPAAAGIQIVISGHSHKPGQCESTGVIFINPGSAGPARFQLPVTLARLDLAIRPWQGEWVQLI